MNHHQAQIMNKQRHARLLTRTPQWLAAFTLTIAGGLSAAPLDLARVPLIINASVPPNIVVSLDDSGSMGFGYLPDSASSIESGASALIEPIATEPSNAETVRRNDSTRSAPPAAWRACG